MRACSNAGEKFVQGAAWKKFLAMVKRQHGDISYLEDPGKYSKSKFQCDVKS